MSGSSITPFSTATGSAAGSIVPSASTGLAGSTMSGGASNAQSLGNAPSVANTGHGRGNLAVLLGADTPGESWKAMREDDNQITDPPTVTVTPTTRTQGQEAGAPQTNGKREQPREEL